MEKPYRTVVQGEASESDEEEEDVKEGAKSVVVEGEASESDEEEIDTSITKLQHKDLPPVKALEHAASFDSIDDITGVPTLSTKIERRPKYDTVLNRKLWESNLSFCNNLNGLVSQAYLSASKEISNCGQQLSRSHASIQDVSHNLRLMTNDLFKLQDCIDIISTCKLLPNIQVPQKVQPDQAAAATESSEGQTLPQTASAHES